MDKEDLPQNKKLIRVEYHYEGGDKYMIEGEDVENYKNNIEGASWMCISHGQTFKSVNWTKIK
jgi:hypothetical protein